MGSDTAESDPPQKRQRKKREWGAIPPPPPPLAPSDDLSEKLAKASLIKFQINSTLNKTPTPAKFTLEIGINDSPHRFVLTKKTTHDYILKACGTVVVGKGRHIKAGTPILPGERSMFLQLFADTQAQLDKAKQLIDGIMAGKNPIPMTHSLAQESTPLPSGPLAGPPPPPPAGRYMSGSPLSPYAGLVQVGNSLRLNIGIDVNQTYGFPLMVKLMGANNEYLGHIEKASNAVVFLKGIGSSAGGMEPLHFLITAQNPTALQIAGGLSENLVQTVREEFETYLKEKFPSALAPPPPPTTATIDPYAYWNDFVPPPVMPTLPVLPTLPILPSLPIQQPQPPTRPIIPLVRPSLMTPIDTPPPGMAPPPGLPPPGMTSSSEAEARPPGMLSAPPPGMFVGPPGMIPTPVPTPITSPATIPSVTVHPPLPEVLNGNKVTPPMPASAGTELPVSSSAVAPPGKQPVVDVPLNPSEDEEDEPERAPSPPRRRFTERKSYTAEDSDIVDRIAGPSPLSVHQKPLTRLRPPVPLFSTPSISLSNKCLSNLKKPILFLDGKRITNLKQALSSKQVSLSSNSTSSDDTGSLFKLVDYDDDEEDPPDPPIRPEPRVVPANDTNSKIREYQQKQLARQREVSDLALEEDKREQRIGKPFWANGASAGFTQPRLMTSKALPIPHQVPTFKSTFRPR